jgi:5-methylthioadenosine/S-adenosylhomocysteine deaminase
MEDNQVDILITGGTLLTMAEGMDIIENPIVGIRNGKILFVKNGNEMPRATYEARKTLDASNSVIMPGLINTHTHVPMVCFRGLADDLPLMRWLNDYIFPVEARYVNRNMVYAGARLAIAEMILSGTTTFCDGYFYESTVGQAALDSGMRAVIAQGFVDLPFLENTGIAKKSEVAERYIEKWKNRSDLITPSLVCHSPYTCLPETLTGIKNIARKHNVTYNIHLAETKDEVNIIKKRDQMKPVEYLKKLDVLDGRTIAAHCNWLEEDEMDMLAAFDVKVSHNPESSMKLAAGVAPVPKLIKRGVTVGLGTDGSASNNDLDMFLEMSTAAKLHKVVERDPTVMDTKTVLRMATINAAKVLGLENQIGSIEAGKCADIIIVDMKQPHLRPVYNCLSHLVYAVRGADVSTTIIAGKLLMKDRKLLNMDLPLIMEEVRKIARDIITDGHSYKSSH